MRVMFSEARSGFKQRIAEAEQHVKTLEELNKKLSAITWNFKEYGDDALYKEALEAIKAHFRHANQR